LKELRALQRKLAYISHFISNLSRCVQPFSKLIMKGVPFVWDKECQNCFDNIKRYLLNRHVLAALVKERPLLLYIAAQPSSIGTLLANTMTKARR
jgi:hypothetical protein